MSSPFSAKIASLRRQHGAPAVDAWIPGALADAADLAHRHGVALDVPFTEGAGGLAFPGCDRDGRRVVLKVPFTGGFEIAAMVAFSGSGAPEVLAVNEGRTAYLMEFVDADPSRAPTAVEVQQLARRLQKPATRLVADLSPRLARRAGRAWDYRYRNGSSAEQSRFHIAVALGAHLVETTEELFLLHGDLHRENIICTPGGLVAIDPGGAVGDPASEVAFYLSWRGHQRPLADEWASVSEPRVDLWTWVWSVLESWTTVGATEREALIETLEPVARAALAPRR